MGLLVRRVLPQAAPGSSGLVWLANCHCDLARLPMGNVVKIASFLHLYCNSLARVAAVFAFPQPNFAGRSVASCANRRRGPPVTNGLWCWLDASDSGSLVLSQGANGRGPTVSVWRDLSGCGIDAVAQLDDTAKIMTLYDASKRTWPSYLSNGQLQSPWGIGGLPAVEFNSFQFMTASDGIRVRTIAMVFHSRKHAFGCAMLFAEDNHADFSLRIPHRRRLVGGVGEVIVADQNDFEYGHPDKLWVNGKTSPDPWREVSNNFPAVVVCVKRAAAATTTRFQLSSRISELNGLIGEVLVYDRELSADEALRTTEYLGRKWGILPEVGEEVGRNEARDRMRTTALLREKPECMVCGVDPGRPRVPPFNT